MMVMVLAVTVGTPIGELLIGEFTGVVLIGKL